jgi:regulator of RNase E activity RraA
MHHHSQNPYSNHTANPALQIGDALIKLKYPLGGFLDGIAMRSPAPGLSSRAASAPRFVGHAVTVEMVAADDTTAPKLEQHFVDHNEAGGVMYVHQPAGLASACWGGLMSTRAQLLGAQAVVVNGRVRDVIEHREMGFPVFAAGTSILGSNTFTRAARVNVPLRFRDDLWIHPGDIMVGDEDGVVVTPPSLVEQVVALCEERAEVDAIMFAELRKGAAMGPLIKNVRKNK